MAATLKDIARETGFSKPTVARILREPHAPFSPTTRDLVLNTARRLGYRPNAAAKAINSGKFNAAVLILGFDPGSSYLHDMTLHGIEESLGLHDMHLVVARIPDAHLSDQGFVPNVLRQNMADGMLVNYTHNLPEKMSELIAQSGAPVIFMNNILPRDSVRPDDAAATRDATAELIRLGHRSIAYAHFLTAPHQQNHYSFAARRDGYIQAMRDAGQTPRFAAGVYPLNEHTALMDSLLTHDSPPTAIIAGSDDCASLAILQSRLKGWRVPQDISVYGVVNTYQFHAAGQYVHSFLLPAKELGMTAVASLVHLLKNPGSFIDERLVPFVRQKGGTVSKARSGKSKTTGIG